MTKMMLYQILPMSITFFFWMGGRGVPKWGQVGWCVWWVGESCQADRDVYRLLSLGQVSQYAVVVFVAFAGGLMMLAGNGGWRGILLPSTTTYFREHKVGAGMSNGIDDI